MDMRLFYRMAAAAAALATVPHGAAAQDGAVLDCPVQEAPAPLKTSIGQAMAGAGDDAANEPLFAQLNDIITACVTRHGIAEDVGRTYANYSVARIGREALIVDLAQANMSVSVIDKVLDFGPGATNPDLSDGNIEEKQVLQIVQGFIESGVDVDAVDGSVWEKVGAYAAATSMYWRSKAQLPF